MGIWLVALLGTFWFLSSIIFPNGGYVYMLTVASFFFSWGAYYSINKHNLIDQMRKIKYAAYLFIPALIAYLWTVDTDYNRYIFLPYIIIGIIFVFVVTSYLFEKGRIHVNHTLSNCSFFVFALHSLILSDLGKLLFMGCQLNDTPIVLLFLYIAIPTITILICIFLYKLLNKYMPTICGLLTGGR